ncbi:MAG: peroxide stress protein YaaA [Caulobacterales bacterium]|nr:peroxide stress protein YaaA [Caulobacterales bacterium]
MLMVISPAKAMNFAAPDRVLPLTTPALKDDIAELDTVTRKLRPRDLRKLMDISEKLADLNHQRFQAFDPSVEEGLQAAVAFNGDVYMGLAARTLDAKAFAWAQDHLRILSGLYGLLRPADAIQPYRLEMGVQLKTRRGKSLYQFWGDRISRMLNEAVEGHKDKTLVNLASQEYFGAVDLKALSIPVVTCRFFEDRGDVTKQISFMAKKARGLMARYAIDGRIDRIEGLKDFAVEGYAFRKDLSTESDWVFLRRRA